MFFFDQSAAVEWNVPDESHDVVNMSYICGSVPVDAIEGLFKKAFKASNMPWNFKSNLQKVFYFISRY